VKTYGSKAEDNRRGTWSYAIRGLSGSMKEKLITNPIDGTVERLEVNEDDFWEMKDLRCKKGSS